MPTSSIILSKGSAVKNPFIPQGVIFDFDGVLVDSLALHIKAWQSAYYTLFGSPFQDEWSPEIIGHSTQWIASFLVKKAHAEGRKDDLILQKNQFLRQGHALAPLLPGALDLMARLRQHGIPYAVASNAPRAFIASTLTGHGLGDVTFFGREDYQQPKPSPEPFFKAARFLGIGVGDHEKIVVFEDSTHGLEAALAAGMVAFGVATQHPAEHLVAAGAHAVCRDLADSLIARWIP